MNFFLIKFIRSLLQLPIYILDFILALYSRFLIFIDPNASESKLEEVYLKRVFKKINSNLKIKNEIFYKPKLDKDINFLTPTKILSFRAKTIYSKEPETIKWIDKFGSKKKIFFDIGANCGTYSLYYAKLYKNTVYSFEPQYQNCVFINENSKLNNLEKKIVIIPAPLFNKEKVCKLRTYDAFLPGTASGTISNLKNYSKKYDKTFYNTLTFSIDHLVQNKILPVPNLIKIDVDGNELEIISGGIKTLNNKNCVSVLIETRYETHKKVIRLLRLCKFAIFNEERNNFFFRKI